MKKYADMLKQLAALIGAVGVIGAFVFSTWIAPAIEKKMSALKYQTQLNTYIIMESITDSTYALRQRKFNQINGIGREKRNQ